MNKLFSLFLDRLAERFAALLAGSLSSRVEGLHAAVQADQQSQLEDLARKYEAEGKTEVAETLRRRATRLTSADLASEAVAVVGQLTCDPPQAMETTGASSQGELGGLPDFTNSPSTTRCKRRKPADNIATLDDTGAGL
jgi:hypothetical protein